MKRLIPSLLCVLASLSASASHDSAADSDARVGYSPTTLVDRIEKSFNDYVEDLKYYDVFLTRPEHFSPIDMREHERTYPYSNHGWTGGDLRQFDLAAAIIEADDESAAIILPFASRHGLVPEVRKAEAVEEDLRVNAGSRHLDVTSLIDIIALDDMSRYASADTAVIYEYDLNRKYLGRYGHCIGIYLRKAAHPALLVKLMLGDEAYKNKERYVRVFLDNIRYGDKPSDALKYAENYVKGSEFDFSTENHECLGLMPPINDETLAELNRQRAWLKEHGLEKMPQVRDEVIDVLNRARARGKILRAQLDSIENADVPEADKIYPYVALERPAIFPGHGIKEWIASNRHYPDEAVKKGAQGSVKVTFTVMGDGSRKDIVVDNEQSVDPLLAQEAVRLVKAMPDYIPALYKGREVSTKEHITVDFVLPPERRMEIAQTVAGDGTLHPGWLADIKAQFPGGEEAMKKWIQDNIRYTPEVVAAMDSEPFSAVGLYVIVDSKGNVVSPEAVFATSKALISEAMRLATSMPRWIPAYVDGKPVNSTQDINIVFKQAVKN